MEYFIGPPFCGRTDQILPDLQLLLPEVPANSQERIHKAVVLQVERAVRCKKRVLNLENVDIVIVDQAPHKGFIHLSEPFRVRDEDHYHVPLEKACGAVDRFVEALSSRCMGPEVKELILELSLPQQERA